MVARPRAGASVIYCCYAATKPHFMLPGYVLGSIMITTQKAIAGGLAQSRLGQRMPETGLRSMVKPPVGRVPAQAHGYQAYLRLSYMGMGLFKEVKRKGNVRGA